MNYKHAFMLLLASLLGHSPLMAQSWSDLVNNNKQNIIVRDTFLRQTFQNEVTDNWNYTIAKGEGEVIDTNTLSSIEGNYGKKAIKLLANSELKFEHFDRTPFDSTFIHVHTYAQLKQREDTVFVRMYKTTENELVALLKTSTSKFWGTNISQAPGFDIVTKKLQNYFLMDTALAYGCNRLYTLFTGKGSWSDATHWSHKAARRNQKALISGALTVDQDAHCVSAEVDNGSLQIAKGKSLRCNTLTLHDKSGGSSSFINEGTLDLTQQLVVEKTFEQKGKWYFFSLPFDVYDVEGFTLKDDTEKGAGNYFYLQTYDSQQRATSGKGWKVVKTTDIPEGQPLIRKHQGYLIALDNSASKTTLHFIATADKLDEEFGRGGTLTIQASNSGSDANKGWTLCGNPLPSPLHLSEIKGKEALDGYVYVYNAGRYQAYSLNSNYAIAPYSAFFVKANEDATLAAAPHTKEVATGQLLSSEAVVLPSDPQLLPTSNAQVSAAESVQILPEKNAVRIEQLPEAGTAQWLRANGQIVQTVSVAAGSSVLPYPTGSAGIYLLRLNYGEKSRVVKCRIY